MPLTPTSLPCFRKGVNYERPARYTDCALGFDGQPSFIREGTGMDHGCGQYGFLVLKMRRSLFSSVRHRSGRSRLNIGWHAATCPFQVSKPQGFLGKLDTWNCRLQRFMPPQPKTCQHITPILSTEFWLRTMQEPLRLLTHDRQLISYGDWVEFA